MPVPLPLLPKSILIQSTLSEALHGVSQPLYDGVTLIVPVPPVDSNVSLAGVGVDSTAADPGWDGNS